MPLSILIVEDEEPIRDVLRLALETADFAVLEAASAKQALSIIPDKRPDLVLIDWMLPESPGIELVRTLRRNELTKDIPLILLTAKGEEEDKLKGFDSGVDDYVTKPFSTKELLARIRAILSRYGLSNQEEKFSFRELELDLKSHRVRVSENEISLGPTEFKLLAFFLGHPERVYSRGQLLDRVWGHNVYIDERTVDVHIRRLRKALEPEGYDGMIQTVRGAGYRFSQST